MKVRISCGWGMKGTRPAGQACAQLSPSPRCMTCDTTEENPQLHKVSTDTGGWVCVGGEGGRYLLPSWERYGHVSGGGREGHVRRSYFPELPSLGLSADVALEAGPSSAIFILIPAVIQP